MTRIEPGALDLALNTWNQAWGVQHEALAMDGKTMKNALDEAGRQTHIMSVDLSVYGNGYWLIMQKQNSL